MTWGACTDPFWQVRSYLMRWHWTTARRAGQWVLLEGSRVIARERELYRLVKRIRSLSTTRLQMERIRAEVPYDPLLESCTKVAIDGDNEQLPATADDRPTLLKTGT